MVGKGGRFEDFLDALLTYESGIDPSKFADYANVSGSRGHRARGGQDDRHALAT